MVRDIPCSPTPILPTLDQKSGVSPTCKKKTAVCNVLNMDELLNIQYHNNRTLLQYLDISVHVQIFLVHISLM